MAFPGKTGLVNIVLIRHGEREFIINLPDQDQPLSNTGKRNVDALGQKIKKNLLELQKEQDEKSPGPVPIIFSSPFLRCFQTAQILAHYLKPRAGVHSVDTLMPTSPGAVRWALNLVSSNLEAGCLVIVGHQPELALISEKLGGKQLQLKNSEAVAFMIEARGGLWEVGKSGLLWRVKG